MCEAFPCIRLLEPGRSQSFLIPDPAHPDLRSQVPNTAIRVDRTTLRRMKASEVIVRTWPNANIPHQVCKRTRSGASRAGAATLVMSCWTTPTTVLWRPLGCPLLDPL